jgi:hypothetical protein
VSSCKFFSIFGHQNPGSGSGSAVRKNAGTVSGSALNQWAFTTLDYLFFSEQNTAKFPAGNIFQWIWVLIQIIDPLLYR